MKARTFLVRALLPAALLFGSTFNAIPAARADEGMWTFNNVPRAEIKKRYGFDVTDAWLMKLQQATVRFPNGTGSLVSADGLVMTNHHIASDSLQSLSTPERDLIKDGYLARTRAEELRVPGLSLDVLVGIEDVTARVNASVKPEMSGGEANAARVTAISGIEAESKTKTSLKSEVVTLYQGGQYNLYRYKQYTDVRVAFAPETQIAFFGGDPDNFMFPRYNLDMALFRVYENDKPLRPEVYLKWSKAGAKPDELVFVTGHPGTTQRLNTYAHLEYLRDTGLPLLEKNFERRRLTLERYSALGTEQRRRALDEVLTIENSLKVYRGQLGGLRDASFMARKKGMEDKLRQSVKSDASKQKAYGDAWDVVAKSRGELPKYEREYRFLGGLTLADNGWAFNSALFNHARTLVRLASESAKPNAERLPEYSDARRAALEGRVNSEAPIYEDLERIKLADSLAFMRDELGADHALVKRVLGDKTPEARAAELVDKTKLKDVAFRRELLAGGKEAVEKSDDPMIALARTVDEDARQLRKRFEGEVTGVERPSYAKIARALFDTEGTKLYPDATFTLRLSYGAVKGYTDDGKQIAPYTYIGGLFERAAKNNFKSPYDLPERWLKKKSALDLKVPFNLVSTNDITGGNSGSPLINREAEIVGLVFDGNIQSLVGSFIYDEAQNRTVSVDSRGMIEALRKVFGADALADELLKG